MAGAIKIAVTGPESTGKSWLCRQLSAYYNADYVAEYAREYIGNLNREYSPEDILYIAREQFEMENRASEHISGGFLFCDTEALVTKIWSMHKFDQCHPWILNRLEESDYTLYLLCDVDIPWQPDPQREHPRLRSFFFNWYRKELEAYGLPFHVVKGKDQSRLQCAISAIEKTVSQIT